MRTRVAKVPRATSPQTRMVEVNKAVEAEDRYRGLDHVRWRFSAPVGKPLFEVTCKCQCGRWWGWVEERRLDELVELLSEGCLKCRE